MKIVIGSDHRGYLHKEYIKSQITLPSWLDIGTSSKERTDYVDYAVRACRELQHKTVDRGVLICGSGIGMAIVANRFAGVYAALVWSKESAYCAAQDDNANFLVLPADFITFDTSVEIIKAWLTTPFKGGRYQQRIDQIDALGGLSLGGL